MKLNYSVTFGIALHFRENLFEQLKKIDCYVISLDESLNDLTQNYQILILTRFFDPVEDSVNVCYLDPKLLGHSTHFNLLDQFMQTVSKLN